jgi:Sec-independent protein translocase protein TatA
LGQGIKEFKKASSDVTNEFHNAMNQETPPAPPVKPPVPPETAAANPPATVPKA